MYCSKYCTYIRIVLRKAAISYSLFSLAGQTVNEVSESELIKQDINLDLLLEECGPIFKFENENQKDSNITVLLTGCTGFLGKFVLMELLKDSRVCKVYCHFRGTESSWFTFHHSLSVSNWYTCMHINLNTVRFRLFFMIVQ